MSGDDGGGKDGLGGSCGGEGTGCIGGEGGITGGKGTAGGDIGGRGRGSSGGARGGGLGAEGGCSGDLRSTAFGIQAERYPAVTACGRLVQTQGGTAVPIQMIGVPAGCRTGAVI
eukprot:2215173-Prymnesium_polylepis.2